VYIGISGSGAKDRNQLTARELDVLKRVAAGLANREIAEHLGLSSRTVDAHLRSIYRKLDVHTRIAATHYALEHDLVGSGGAAL